MTEKLPAKQKGPENKWKVRLRKTGDFWRKSRLSRWAMLPVSVSAVLAGASPSALTIILFGIFLLLQILGEIISDKNVETAEEAAAREAAVRAELERKEKDYEEQTQELQQEISSSKTKVQAISKKLLRYISEQFRKDRKPVFDANDRINLYDYVEGKHKFTLIARYSPDPEYDKKPTTNRRNYEADEGVIGLCWKPRQADKETMFEFNAEDDNYEKLEGAARVDRYVELSREFLNMPDTTRAQNIRMKSRNYICCKLTDNKGTARFVLVIESLVVHKYSVEKSRAVLKKWLPLLTLLGEEFDQSESEIPMKK